MFSGSQTSCYSWNDRRPHGSVLLLFRSCYVKSICLLTRSRVFVSAPGWVAFMRVPLYSTHGSVDLFNSDGSCRRDFSFLSCCHQILKSKISIYRAHWKIKSFLLPPPPPASKPSCIWLQLKYSSHCGTVCDSLVLPVMWWGFVWHCHKVLLTFSTCLYKIIQIPITVCDRIQLLHFALT